MKQSKNIISKIIYFTFVALITCTVNAQTYKIVDTGQQTFYGNTNEITIPSSGEAFYGQDAQFNGNEPSYTNNNDGTITDNVTGLMWQKSPDMDGDGDIDYDDKLSYDEALAGAASFKLAGYSDWRLPTIKEQYSLIMFSGLDPSGYDGSSTDGFVPFINTDYFDFGFGDTDAGERIIDAQFATLTKYISTTMINDETMFGVNFADGRIKGYPTGAMPGQTEDKQFYVLYVRGNTEYGLNDFVDNGNGTISDNATGLMWQQGDSEAGLNWEEALAWVEQKNSETFLVYDDWRLPNVKELQSIVDYSRAPAITNSPAINELFRYSEITDEGNETNYPFYWSGTTHANMQNGGYASYVCFGEALGWMEMPPNSGSYTLLDVHGAGAQRSDPKTGSSDDYPYGHGPQGDVIRINNYVRLVRDINVTGVEESQSEATEIPNSFKLNQNYPNPFNPSTHISVSIPESGNYLLRVYNLLGKEIATLLNDNISSGIYKFDFDGSNLTSGIYFYTFQGNNYKQTKKMILMK
jgi:Protein of unknown function (DUF1566)/Secretion system C-terminal sorting domain